MGFHEQAKPFRDSVPIEAWKQVKLAIRQTIAKIGKADAVTAHFKAHYKAFDGGRISEWCDFDRPTSLPTLWQVAQIEAMAGVDWITQAMCALHDGDLVKRSRAEEEGAVIIRLASAAREIGEALSSSATVAANPGCRRSADHSIREGREAIRSLKELIAAIEAQIGEAA